MQNYYSWMIFAMCYGIWFSRKWKPLKVKTAWICYWIGRRTDNVNNKHCSGIVECKTRSLLVDLSRRHPGKTEWIIIILTRSTPLSTTNGASTLTGHNFSGDTRSLILLRFFFFRVISESTVPWVFSLDRKYPSYCYFSRMFVTAAAPTIIICPYRCLQQ